MAAAAPRTPPSASAVPPPGVRPQAPAPAPAAGSAPAGEATLQKIDLAPGAGAPAKTGDVVSVHYTGTLKDGSKFDSSRDRNAPFDFKLGAGSVIVGWDQGVVGMKVGGKRKLVIPYAMAYGEAGRPPKIPARSDLVFEIELLKINPPTAQQR